MTTHELLLAAKAAAPALAWLGSDTRVTAADLQTPPACAVLLAANRTGCAFLAERRRTGTIPIVTKRSDVPQTAAATRQLRLTERAAALWTLALPHPVPPATLLRQSAYVEKD